MLIFALIGFHVDAFAQVHSVHQSRVRKAVAIDCDTALTSDLRIVRRPYKFSDNIYWGFNLGANRPLSKEISNQAFFPKVRPNAEFVVGKYFSPWISAGIDLGYSMQEEFYSTNTNTSYQFHTLALSLEGQLCLNRLFTRYTGNEKFQVYAIGSIGIQSAFAFKTDTLFNSLVEEKTKFAPLFRAGAMFEFRVAEGSSITLRGLWTGTTTPVCGLSKEHSHRGLELSLGYLCRLPNHYASRSFQHCRGNEIYYFRELEDQLLSDHQRQLKRQRRGKAEAPIMAAEQDSVLIFPCGYAYLTKRQEAKLDKVAQHLASNPQLSLSIDLYPIVADDPKMTPAQSVQRCEVAIRSYLTKHSRYPVNESQLRFHQHPNQDSPIANQSIWVHGAFLRYQQ